MPEPPAPMSRRAFLALGTAGAAAAVLAACSAAGDAAATSGASPTSADIGGTAGSTAGPATSVAAPTSLAASTTSRAGAPASSTSSSASASATAPSGPARFITRGDASTNAVALTFHTDGDLKLDQRLLDVLASHDAHVTNFIVGKWLDANPTWARKLTDAGHELANHTYNHETFGSLSAPAMASEIDRCRDLLVKLTGSGGRFFRPSGTDDGTAQPSAAIMKAATDAGYPYVAGWDVEPFDYQDPGAAAVQDRVLKNVKPGSIVSLHFNHPGTVDALPKILDGLASRQLKTVTLSQLLG